MQQVATINDIKQDVLDALQGRTDVTDSQIARYVVKTIYELTNSNPFPELQSTGPQVNLTAGQAVYPVSLFVNTGDEYSMPESFALFVDTPNNTIVAPVRYRTPAGIETMTAPAVLGVPAWFTRFDKNFHFGPVPNANYTVYLRYQVKHPFPATPDLSDPIYIGRDWLDIVAYGAAMRICILKRWTDQYHSLREILYGDPEAITSDGKRGRPGLIMVKLFQQERDQKYNTRSVTVMQGRYGAR
jgi:hypothetical protein